ncbi:MAG TPA: hypothetical protein VNT60_02920 [Deinococcales bacterium]|nr:hypothetical protein [Deinococcales bacterium]
MDSELYRVAVELSAPDGSAYAPHSYYEVEPGVAAEGALVLLRRDGVTWELAVAGRVVLAEEDELLGRVLRVLPPRRKK